MSKDTGWPAFPAGAIRKTRQRPNDPGSDFVVSDMTEPRNAGMTLRDYFAVKAMHQFIAGAVFPKGYDRSNDLAMVAALAYETADAMLEARK